MAKTVNVQFNDQLYRHIGLRTEECDVYSTPSEYIRDLVRRDMEQCKRSYDMEVADMLLASVNSKAKPKLYNSKTFVNEQMQALKKRKTARAKDKR